ncbi:MFS transporter [Gulbenkiania mobilis]|uniref:MFS transporter n=1 Tax=Gulbenkiania mobilis TaxID=397457 RepID=UPI0006BBB8C7|nr:MFS transporter [Gulbenkiania mobilis]
MPTYLKPTPEWEEHEKPTLPGSASMPWHPPWRRVAYALVALLVGLTGGLGNALLSANLPTIQGELGLTPSEGAWLTASYVMSNVTANLLIYKFRQQYGMRLFTEIGLGVYALLSLAHLLVGSFSSTVLLRLASGFAAAPCTTLGTLYMLQALPRSYTGKMLVVGVGIGQLATPLAWLLSPALLDLGQWHNLYLFEAGLALCAFAAVVVLKLPPGIHIKVFEPLDFLTFALLAPAAAMVIAVLSQGYAHWWFDTPWLGWLLAGAVALFTLAWLVEHNRARPLLQTRWLLEGPTIRFIIGAFLIRFLTSEQTFGAVGLMRTLGMGPDQLQPLFGVILIGTLAGIALSAFSFGPRTLIPQILTAIVLFGCAAALDYDRTSLDRPQDFFLSQFLVAVGAGMFMGPLLLLGIMQAIKKGPDHIVTFMVVLSMSQTLGGFMGPALLSTYQLHREHVYSAQIVSRLNPADPAVAQRIRQQQQLYAATTADPVLRSAQGMAQLSQAARREANVRAYNDVFALCGLLALLFLSWSLLLMLKGAYLKKRSAPADTDPATKPSS